MNNYERLKTIMKNLCRELIGCYSIEEDGASVEDAYYLIDQYHKPAIVVTICRKVCEDDYREKAIFYVDSNNVSKFFLMDMNCKVSRYQIPSMTFNSFDVLHDIFKTFDNEYYRYRYISNYEGNKEECSSEKDKDKDIKDSISRKMSDIGEAISNGFGESVKKFMKTYMEEDIKDKEIKYRFIDIEKQEESQITPYDLPIIILDVAVFPNLYDIYYKKYYGKDHETETGDKSNVDQETLKNEDKKAESKEEEQKDKDIKDSISRKMSDIGEVIRKGFDEGVKKVMKEKEDTEDKEKSEEEDIEKEVCKEMKNYKPIWDSYTNGIFSVNVERLKEITKRINDTLGGILGNEESEVKEDAGKEDDNVEESSEDEETDVGDDEEDEDEDNLCDICRDRMEKSKESKDDIENRFKWFLISAKIDIFDGVIGPVFVDEWPIEYITTKPLTYVDSNNSIVEVSFVVPCDTSKDSEEDLENIYKNKLEEVVDHIYSDDCNDLTDDKELKDVFDFAINAFIFERCNEFTK